MARRRRTLRSGERVLMTLALLPLGLAINYAGQYPRFTTAVFLAGIVIGLSTWYVGHERRVRLARVARGICPDCGYDTRASPGRCSECGRAMPLMPQPISSPDGARGEG